MKRLLLVLSAGCFVASSAFAQFDEVKNLLILKQTKPAKEKLDAALTKPKNAAKPEAMILKAAILADMMNDPANAAKAVELRTEAIDAYNKYLEMDPKKELIGDAAYVNAPILFYSNFFNEGVKYYNKKDWTTTADYFKNTVFWSDFIIANKMAKMQFDTSAVLLAGAAYQNLKNDEEAIKYFSRLTDRKIGGADNEFVYQFMMGHYFRKNDMASFEKFRALGKELYPKSEYFTYSEMDFIASMEDEKEKMARYEAKIEQNPSDIALAENYGYLLFDRLNDEKAVQLINDQMIEDKMVKYLSRAGEAKPNDGKPFYYLGNHYINKAVKVNDLIAGVSAEIKKANAGAKPDKTGKLPPPPKELTDKRDSYKKMYDAEVDRGLPFLLKSAEAYGKATDLKGVEMQNYKRLVDQLILIYGDKKTATKVAADKAKFEAEEKKWNAVYSKISH